MHEEQPALAPARTWTWCHWHQGYTATGLLIAAIEQGSGPGTSLYACEPCRTEHRLTPWNESTGI